MYCPKCGKQMPDDSKFCGACGCILNLPDAESNTSAESLSAVENSQNRSNFPQKKSNRSPKGIIISAAILLVVVVIGFSMYPRSDGNHLSRQQTGQTTKDDTKERTEEADQYFSRGDYDTALELYQKIDTEYARRKAHSIECIDVSDEISQKWLESVDPGAYNIALSLMGGDFEFDTEYDIDTYTFYTKMYYGDIYTALSGFMSDEELSKGVTSAGHEKTTYNWFRERGYDDITCVFNSYGSDGKLWSSFSYGRKDYETDQAQEQNERSNGSTTTSSGSTLDPNGSDYSWVEGEYHMAHHYPLEMDLSISEENSTPDRPAIYFIFIDDYQICGDGIAYYVGGDNFPRFEGEFYSTLDPISIEYDGYNFIVNSPAQGYEDVSFFEDSSSSSGDIRGINNDYIFPNSSFELLTDADVYGMTAQEVNYAKNEIYARNGRRFNSEELQAYFDAKLWYYGYIEPEDFTESMLSEVEKENVTFLAKVEAELKSGN